MAIEDSLSGDVIRTKLAARLRVGQAMRHILEEAAWNRPLDTSGCSGERVNVAMKRIRKQNVEKKGMGACLWQ